MQKKSEFFCSQNFELLLCQLLGYINLDIKYERVAGVTSQWQTKLSPFNHKPNLKS